MGLIAVYTTVATREDARAIANALVERGLAACVQIEAIESVYRWQGALVEEPEYRLRAKTTHARYADVEAAIRSLHRYELPAIFAVSLEPVHAPYRAWVEENVHDA